jgi:CRP-like cAMP-binding protein
MEQVSFEEGEVIFKQGSLPTYAYVIVSGAAEMLHVEGDRKEMLGTVESGGVFGEMALVDD